MELNKILVIDSNQYQAVSAQISLARLGYDVMLADSYGKAMAIASQEMFTLAIGCLDNSPHELAAFCTGIHNGGRQRGIPLIFSTHFTDSSRVVQAMDYGCKNFISKPFEPVHLGDRVIKIVRMLEAYPVAKTISVPPRGDLNERQAEILESSFDRLCTIYDVRMMGLLLCDRSRTYHLFKWGMASFDKENRNNFDAALVHEINHDLLDTRINPDECTQHTFFPTTKSNGAQDTFSKKSSLFAPIINNGKIIGIIGICNNIIDPFDGDDTKILSAMGEGYSDDFRQLVDF